MAFPTLQEITQDVLQLSGLVNGTSVQTYSEPLVKHGVNLIFDQLWKKRKWDHMWEWVNKALDGTTGLISGNLTGVQQVEDIADIRLPTSLQAVPRSPDSQHLYVTGSTPLFHTVLPWNHASAATKFIKFWPITATGSVELYVGYRPDAFENDADIVPMDKGLMVKGVLWWILADDGTNPASADKALTSFDVAYTDLIARINQGGIGHGGGRRRGPDFVIQQ